MNYKNSKTKNNIAFLNVGENNIHSNNGFKFCPVCLNEDTALYGEMYAHVCHQLPGYNICTKHGKVLCNYKFQDIVNGNIVDMLSESQSRFNIPSNLTDKLFTLALDINDIIQLTPVGFSLEKVKQKYFKILDIKGYTRYSGKIDIKKLRLDIRNYYSDDLLNFISLSLQSDNNYWLSDILCNSLLSVSPVAHTLLIRFLFGSVQNFFMLEDEITVDNSNKKYPCLNPIAEHYKKKIISRYKIKRNGRTKEIIGIFYCDCGFVYSRKMNSDDEYKASRILEYGELWDQRLNEYTNNGNYNKTQLSNFMGCGRGKIDSFLSNKKSKVTIR